MLHEVILVFLILNIAMRLVLVGDSKVGKTLLIHRLSFIENKTRDYEEHKDNYIGKVK